MKMRTTHEQLIVGDVQFIDGYFFYSVDFRAALRKTFQRRILFRTEQHFVTGNLGKSKFTGFLLPNFQSVSWPLPEDPQRCRSYSDTRSAPFRPSSSVPEIHT